MRFLQRFFASAQNDLPGEEKESFGMLSRLPVFNDFSITCDSCQDSSLPLRMTAAGGEKNHSHAFWTTGIYWYFGHLRYLLKFFAALRMTYLGRRKSHLVRFPNCRYLLAFPVTCDSYKDSSLALRMTGLEKRKSHLACFPDFQYFPAFLSPAVLPGITSCTQLKN